MSQSTANFRSTPRHYIAIVIALLALLAVTVASAFIDWNQWLPGRGWGLTFAIAIAAAKAILIVLYFMHVRGARPRIAMFASAGFLWLAILISLVMTDYLARDGASPDRPITAPLVQ